MDSQKQVTPEEIMVNSTRRLREIEERRRQILQEQTRLCNEDTRLANEYDVTRSAGEKASRALGLFPKEAK